MRWATPISIPTALNSKNQTRELEESLNPDDRKSDIPHLYHISILQFRPLMSQLHPVQQGGVFWCPPTIRRMSRTRVHTSAHAHIASMLKARPDALWTFRTPLPIVHPPSARVRSGELTLKQVSGVIVQREYVVSLLGSSAQGDDGA